VETLEQAIESGKLYSVGKYREFQDGVMVIDMPDSIYAVAILSDLLIEPGIAFLPRFLSGCFLPMAIFVQVALCCFLQEIASAGERCAHGNPMLRVLCSGLFVAVMMRQLHESLTIYRYVAELPSWQEWMESACEDGDAGLLFKSANVTVAGGGAKFMTVPGTGITTRRRVWGIAVVLCKVAIQIFLVYVGLQYIATSDSNERLLLNSVVVGFVSDVDDIVYCSFVPGMMRIKPPSIGLEQHATKGVSGRFTFMDQWAQDCTLLCSLPLFFIMLYCVLRSIR